MSLDGISCVTNAPQHIKLQHTKKTCTCKHTHSLSLSLPPSLPPSLLPSLELKRAAGSPSLPEHLKAPAQIPVPARLGQPEPESGHRHRKTPARRRTPEPRRASSLCQPTGGEGGGGGRKRGREGREGGGRDGKRGMGAGRRERGRGGEEEGFDCRCRFCLRRLFCGATQAPPARPPICGVAEPAPSADDEVLSMYRRPRATSSSDDEVLSMSRRPPKPLRAPLRRRR